MLQRITSLKEQYFMLKFEKNVGARSVAKVLGCGPDPKQNTSYADPGECRQLTQDQLSAKRHYPSTSQLCALYSAIFFISGLIPDIQYQGEQNIPPSFKT